jgi:hypothetical protein
MKNKLTIYNVYVEMENQEQCDRMKQLCIDNELPIWDEEIAFEITKAKNEKSWFWFEKSENEFFIVDLLLGETPIQEQNKVTEQQFIELLNIKQL